MFADHEPDRRKAPRLEPADGLVVRFAEDPDLRQVARIVAQREGGDPEGQLEHLAHELAAGRSEGTPVLWVADLRGRVIGHARAGLFAPSREVAPDVAPAGWYLMGVIVDAAFRRRGVGEALTRERLAWISARSREAYYVANARNRVSIDLHAKLGFIELSRCFSMPGVSFTDGTGVLFRCALHSPTLP